MEFITHAEKVGLVKGEIKGLLRGLKGILETKFAAGLALMGDVGKIDDPQRLDLILQATRKAASLDEIRSLLSAPAEPPVP